MPAGFLQIPARTACPGISPEDILAGCGVGAAVIAGLRLAEREERGTGCGVYISDMKLRIAGGRAYYYPDVMLSGEPAAPDAVYKDAPCLVAEVLSPSTARIDTREKLQAYCGIESLRYYLLVESERAAVSYRIRGADGESIAASLDPGERIEIECGPVRAGLGLREIYEDTGLAAE